MALTRAVILSGGEADASDRTKVDSTHDANKITSLAETAMTVSRGLAPASGQHLFRNRYYRIPGAAVAAIIGFLPRSNMKCPL